MNSTAEFDGRFNGKPRANSDHNKKKRNYWQTKIYTDTPNLLPKNNFQDTLNFSFNPNITLYSFNASHLLSLHL